MADKDHGDNESQAGKQGEAPHEAEAARRSPQAGGQSDGTDGQGDATNRMIFAVSIALGLGACASAPVARLYDPKSAIPIASVVTVPAGYDLVFISTCWRRTAPVPASRAPNSNCSAYWGSASCGMPAAAAVRPWLEPPWWISRSAYSRCCCTS